MKVDNQLVGCPIGEEVTLACFIEAYPNPNNYWMRQSAATAEIIGEQPRDREIIMNRYLLIIII